jgi:hypothetical protein
LSESLDSSAQVPDRIPVGCQMAISNAQVVLGHGVIERDRLRGAETQDLAVRGYLEFESVLWNPFERTANYILSMKSSILIVNRFQVVRSK